MNVINTYNSVTEHKVSYRYWLSLPEDYAVSGKEYPLIVFLHGAGERGTNPELVKVHGVPKLIDRGMKLDAVTISPQCPDNMVWDTQVYDLKAFIDSIIASYRIDKKRITCTGMSMGGFGTWMLGITFPEFFHKIAPVCGGGMEWLAPLLKDTGVRAYHGLCDGVVAPSHSRAMVERINAAGGHAELFEYEGVGHDSWVNAYEKSDLIQWLIAE